MALFRTLYTIPEHILYSLKVPILGQFHPFSAICPAQLWGSHPARFGDRVRISYLLLALNGGSGIGCDVFQNLSVSPRGPLLHNFTSSINPIMGVASSPLWGPSSCILSTTVVFVGSGIGCAHFIVYSVIQMAPTDSGK